jgi:ABC-type Zn2+ transport system substrate-binding protein/surface adhesin
MVADVVREVGGKHVSVVQLMKDGTDPHLYKATTHDVDQLAAADVIFYSGLHLEGKMGDIFVRMARSKPTFARHCNARSLSSCRKRSARLKQSRMPICCCRRRPGARKKEP